MHLTHYYCITSLSLIAETAVYWNILVLADFLVEFCFTFKMCHFWYFRWKLEKFWKFWKMSKIWKNVQNLKIGKNLEKEVEILEKCQKYRNCQKFGKMSKMWKNVENLENPHNFWPVPYNNCLQLSRCSKFFISIWRGSDAIAILS